MLRSIVRIAVVSSLLVGSFLSLPSLAQEKSDIRHQIADAYGLASWPKVDQIRYTFSFEAGARKAARTWTWDTKADKVTYDGPDSAGKPTKVTYARASMPPDVVKNVDPDFINDQYWLLFPLHLVWDKDVTVEDKGMSADPTGKTKGKVRKVVVTYPKAGGYTPGDMYDLFVGADNRVVSWNFHKGGEEKATLTTTWTDYKMAGPILFAEEHRGTHTGKPIHIALTSVEVKLAGASDFVEAK
ncbi:MAG TPA: hypothetical protein VNI81_05575 [Candidatus Limnocylindrales bacterium]|nr:hypothetical protein [Candidatus Limnocylindrales bacterium]